MASLLRSGKFEARSKKRFALQNSNLKHFDEFRYFLGVQELQPETFAGSASLESITVPRSVVTINYGAFADCPGLMSLSVDTANTHYDSREDCNAIVNTSTNTMVLGCYNSTFPSSVTAIGMCAFLGCNMCSEY